MNRRTFVKNSLAAASGALLADPRFIAGGQPPQNNLPGEVPASKIGSARFPDGFLWGLASASYQVEGAWNADGKGESNWDRFSHTVGKIKGGATADVSCDHYHHYKEDLAILKRLNQKSYRFSTSRARIQPAGTGPVNRADGYTQRYGFTYVDFRNQKRTIKDSGLWYGRVSAANRLLV